MPRKRTRRDPSPTDETPAPTRESQSPTRQVAGRARKRPLRCDSPPHAPARKRPLREASPVRKSRATPKKRSRDKFKSTTARASDEDANLSGQKSLDTAHGVESDSAIQATNVEADAATQGDSVESDTATKGDSVDSDASIKADSEDSDGAVDADDDSDSDSDILPGPARVPLRTTYPPTPGGRAVPTPGNHTRTQQPAPVSPTPTTKTPLIQPTADNNTPSPLPHPSAPNDDPPPYVSGDTPASVFRSLASDASSTPAGLPSKSPRMGIRGFTPPRHIPQFSISRTKGTTSAEYADSDISRATGKASAEYAASDISRNKGKARAEYAASDISRNKGKARAEDADSDIPRNKGKGRAEDADSDVPWNKGKGRAEDAASDVPRNKGKGRAEDAASDVSRATGKGRAEKPHGDVSRPKGKRTTENLDGNVSRPTGKRTTEKPGTSISRSKGKVGAENAGVTPSAPQPEDIIIIDSASSDTNKPPDDEIELVKVERHDQDMQGHQNYPADGPSDARDHSDDYMQQGAIDNGTGALDADVDPSSAVVLPPGVKNGRIRWGDDDSEWESEEEEEDRIHGVHGTSRRFFTDRKFTLKVKYVLSDSDTDDKNTDKENKGKDSSDDSDVAESSTSRQKRAPKRPYVRAGRRLLPNPHWSYQRVSNHKKALFSACNVLCSNIGVSLMVFYSSARTGRVESYISRNLRNRDTRKWLMSSIISPMAYIEYNRYSERQLRQARARDAAITKMQAATREEIRMLENMRAREHGRLSRRKFPLV